MRALLARAVQARASDLHLSAGMPPLVRIDGDLHPIKWGTNEPGWDAGQPGPGQPEQPGRQRPPEPPGWQRPPEPPEPPRPLEAEQVECLIAATLNEAQRKAFRDGLDLDFSLECPGLSRFRINAYRQRRGAAAALRVVPSRVRPLAELAPPPVQAALESWSLLPRGLVLCTGATGSGKSTTLAALVDHRNAAEGGHILTVEDPIEFVHTSRRSLITQREVGADVTGFPQALRSALREDPDVILVGELRDLETIRLALTAAETGHLVLATLHTAGAAQAPGRLVDVFPHGEQATVRTMLAETLQGVATQVLCRRRDGRGRVAAYELLRATPAVRHLIREDKPAQLVSVMQSGLAQGMQTLDQHLRALVHEGTIGLEEARLHARQPENF